MFMPVSGMGAETLDYLLDAGQKSVLFLDVLRERGNIYMEHLNKGKPPVLIFDYKVIMDGRKLERPVNHDLIQIIPGEGIDMDSGERPIVIIDPRAGHGPGIGGSKQDSEIGVAMAAGHPVYFITFYPEPCPGQVYADVEQAQTRFIEEVIRRHPKSEKPTVIGNCQGGWAVALLGADRPDITGPLVLNGSPLSYWAGLEGQNAMRYMGGILGGVWAISLISDLNNGTFDGVNLVSSFENLNPSNTWWTKQYNVWANVDTEAERYLNFEKWWNGYFFMTSEEIHFIVGNLFIANKLEQGKLELKPGKKIDLKNLTEPVLVFASKGDNITPPQQALNWIASVYGTVEELKRRQQTIIYMVHEKVGHLGIFVSGAVAKKEHREIIKSIDLLDYLPPGLYEMRIEEKETPLPGGIKDYNVRFEERQLADIMAFDDGREDEKAFYAVAAISDINDRFYRAFASPLVRMVTNAQTAEMNKWLHPLRMSRYGFSDLNPFMLPIRSMASIVRENRRPVNPKNSLVAVEKVMSASIMAGLDWYRDMRDATTEFIFRMLYDNPCIEMIFPETRDASGETPAEQAVNEQAEDQAQEDDREKWLDAMEKGGFAEGIVRVIVALADADAIFDQREFKTAEDIILADDRLRKIRPDDFKRMVTEQSRILETDNALALTSLKKLLTTPRDRKIAIEIAQKMAEADLIVSGQEKTLIDTIKNILAGDEATHQAKMQENFSNRP
jgi:poly(3-hydroxyalkanoate) synthetase